MNLLSKRKYPQLYSNADDQPLDLTQVCKKILRGEYRNLAMFEMDLGLVLTNFEAALQPEKPSISEKIQKIKVFYKGLKARVMDDLEPFIVHRGSKGGNISNELPKFKDIPVNPRMEDVIRCICERFSDEGTMVQCDRCGVWQHCECMGVDHPGGAGSDQKNNRRSKTNRRQARRSKFFSPVIPCTPVTSAGEDSCSSSLNTTPVKSSSSSASTTACSSVVCTPGTPSPRMNTRPLALRAGEEKVFLELLDDSELILNVKDPIPMEINEDSNQSVEGAGSTSQKPLSMMDISDMDTQRIDVDGDMEMNGPPADLVVVEPTTTSAPGEKTEKPAEDQFYCEQCEPRELDREVRLNRGESDEPEKKQYTSFVREDGLMIRINDTVYVLRDPPSQPGQVVIDRPTYKTAGPLVPKDCDIFRVEGLWIDPEYVE